jgi:hypothetical protein
MGDSPFAQVLHQLHFRQPTDDDINYPMPESASLLLHIWIFHQPIL